MAVDDDAARWHSLPPPCVDDNSTKHTSLKKELGVWMEAGLEPYIAAKKTMIMIPSNKNDGGAPMDDSSSEWQRDVMEFSATAHVCPNLH